MRVAGSMLVCFVFASLSAAYVMRKKGAYQEQRVRDVTSVVVANYVRIE